MEVTHNHNAKSQLAKLLATENITVEHKSSAQTAWFDVKNRVLTLPVWREMSNDLYDLLVVHEVGHALDTPNDGLLEAIESIAKRVSGKASSRAMGAVKGFLNVIEDARIDKRQKRRFPGARRNYVKGYQELIDRDFFGTLTKDVNAMSFIDRLNIYCKGGSMLGIKFNAEEKAWLSKVEAAETFAEVLTLTEQIFAWSKQKMEDEQEQAADQRAKSGMSDDDSDEFDDFSDDESEDDESEEETSGSGSYDYDEDGDDEDGTDEDDQSEDDDGSSQKSDDPIAGGSVDDSESLPESETEKAWQEKIQTLVQNSQFEYVYARLPKLVDYNQTVVDYKQVLAEQRTCATRFGKDWLDSVRSALQKFKSDEMASVSFMVKEFEMRKAADEYSRTSISKTGVIDTNKLHSYKYNDDLFRRITTVASGKNHGFVMFVDWSGSMDQHLNKTIRQLLSLVMFCRRVQVPFDVYTFRSVNYTDKYQGLTFTQNDKELDAGNFFARNVLSSRMTAQEMNDAMFHMFIMASGARLECDGLGSTPLNPCIMAAPEIVNRFKARSKVQIVNTIFLTDGDSDPISGIHGRRSHKPEKYIIQDEVTKKNYEIPSAGGGRYSWYSLDNRTMTPILFKILRERTGCNLIGFHITVDGFEREYRKHNVNSYGEHYNNAKVEWKNNGFFSVSNAGYDEYYIINPGMFKTASGNLTVSGDKITKRKLASEFIKFSEKKTVSRVLLSKVVKRIAA